MSFQPSQLRGATAGTAGEVDYRLARHAVLTEFRRGRLRKHEICDAHPELLRAARNVGAASSQDCPVCEETQVVFVSYVFGDRLKAANGRCITSKAELAALARKVEELACYVVEVCPECSWNHLARRYVLGRGHPA